MACGTTAIWRLMATSQILLHVLETSLQLHSAVSHLTSSHDVSDVTQDVTSRRTAGCVMVGVLVMSSCVTNAVSAWMTYRGQDFTSQRLGCALCAALHIFQLGPVWRYFKLVVVGDWIDVQELLRLRVLQVSLQNSAYMVLQGGLLLGFHHPGPHLAELTLGLVVSFASIVFSYTCCSHTASNLLTFVTNFQTKSRSTCMVCSRTACSALRLATRVLRHTFMLASRILAIALFAHAWRAWVLLLTVGHLLLFYFIYLLWSVVHRHKRGYISVVKQMPDVLLFGCVEVFDYSGRLYRSTRSVLVYYAVMLIENSSMGLMWYFTQEEAPFKDTLLTLIFSLFILGVAAGVISEDMLCRHYRPALHNEHKEENNNLDSIASNESLPPATNCAIGHGEPVDFDLDLNDILFASTKYNPNVVGDVMLVVASEVQRPSRPDQELASPETVMSSGSHKEALHEVQTSSDSGFVSRLFDTSLSLENDSEGYSRAITTPTLNGSTLCGPTDTKENTLSNVPLCKDVLRAASGLVDKMVLNKSTQSLHNTAVSVHPQNSVQNHRPRRLPRGKAASTSVMHRVGRPGLGVGDSESDSSRAASSCSSNSYKVGKVKLTQRKRTFSRSRSVPHASRCHPQNQPRKGHLQTGPSKSSFTNGQQRRYQPEFLCLSSSSDTTSESFFNSFQRRSSSTSSSSSSDSQSLGDSEFGLARTWPPGRKCAIINIYDLPLEQISAKEHVLRWLDGADIESSSPHTDSADCVLSYATQDKPNHRLSMHHRFDSFRDVHIEYIDSARDLTHMSDSGFVGCRVLNANGTGRPRTLSESGAANSKHNNHTVCGLHLPVSGKRRWFDHKILRRLSSLSGSKPKMVVVNLEPAHDYEPHILGLESSV